MEKKIMYKLMNSVRSKAKINYRKDLELQNLINEVTITECDLDAESNYLTPYWKLIIRRPTR